MLRKASAEAIIRFMSVAARIEDPLLEQIARTIVRHCEPRRIILYGSRARGDSDAESDYDLMVELDEPAPNDLELELIKALLDEDVDVFVTTAREFAEQRDDVGLLAHQIAREGRVIYARDGGPIGASPSPHRVSEPRRRPMPGSVDMWIKRAEADFRAAMLDPESEIDPCVVCFHAHQCAEKYVKALIVCLHIPPPRTHRLGKLLDLCPETLNVRPVRDTCAALLKLFRLARYPSAREPTAVEARRAAVAAGVVRTAARALIDQLRNLD